MKKNPVSLTLCLLVLGFIFACKKSNSGSSGPTDPNGTYLSSATSWSPQQRIVDSFHYDSSHRIDTFMQTLYDTTSGFPQFNTITVQFLYDGSNTYPSWYWLYDIPLGNTGEYHLLSYDAQGRISKDTSLSGSDFVTYYTYPNNNIAVTVLPEGTPQYNQVDTFYITNSNIASENIYTSVIPGQPDQLQDIVKFNYASTTNPGYHAPIAGSIGPLLTIIGINNFGGFVDFVSKNAINQASDAGTNAQYTLTNDNKGRLSRQSLTTGGAANYIQFEYY